MQAQLVGRLVNSRLDYLANRCPPRRTFLIGYVDGLYAPLEDVRSRIGIQRRWRVDFVGSDRDGQAASWVSGRSEAEGCGYFFGEH
jgi:hypothetical protein